MTLMLRNATVRIADLVPEGEQIIPAIEATNVTFLGPAVLYFPNSIFLKGAVDFPPDLEALLWDIPDDRNSVGGAITILDGSFTDCKFASNIGIAGRSSFLADLTRAMHYDPDL